MSRIVQFFTFPCLAYSSQNFLSLDCILDIFRVTFLFLSSAPFILLPNSATKVFNYKFFICFLFVSLCGYYLLSLILFLYFQDFFFYVIKHFKYCYLLCLILQYLKSLWVWFCHLFLLNLTCGTFFPCEFCDLLWNTYFTYLEFNIWKFSEAWVDASQEDYTGISCFIVLCFFCASQILYIYIYFFFFFFFTNRRFVVTCLEQVSQHHFSNSILLTLCLWAAFYPRDRG